MVNKYGFPFMQLYFFCVDVAMYCLRVIASRVRTKKGKGYMDPLDAIICFGAVSVPTCSKSLLTKCYLF